MVLEILCVEPIYPQYSGVLETCLALRYWFFEVLGSKSVKESPHLTLLVVTENQFFSDCLLWFLHFFHHEHLGRDLFSRTAVLENAGAILVDIFENFSEKLSK